MGTTEGIRTLVGIVVLVAAALLGLGSGLVIHRQCTAANQREVVRDIPLRPLSSAQRNPRVHFAPQPQSIALPMDQLTWSFRFTDPQTMRTQILKWVAAERQLGRVTFPDGIMIERSRLPQLLKSAVGKEALLALAERLNERYNMSEGSVLIECQLLFSVFDLSENAQEQCVVWLMQTLRPHCNSTRREESHPVSTISYLNAAMFVQPSSPFLTERSATEQRLVWSFPSKAQFLQSLNQSHRYVWGRHFVSGSLLASTLLRNNVEQGNLFLDQLFLSLEGKGLSHQQIQEMINPVALAAANGDTNKATQIKFNVMLFFKDMGFLTGVFPPPYPGSVV